MTTGGRIAAFRSHPRGNDQLVKPDQQDERETSYFKEPLHEYCLSVFPKYGLPACKYRCIKGALCL